MRSPPKTVASSSGNSAIANTFHRTGQCLIDHLGGRLAVAVSPAPSPVAGASSAAGWPALVGRANIVTGRRPCYRPLFRDAMLTRRSLDFLLDLPAPGSGVARTAIRRVCQSWHPVSTIITEQTDCGAAMAGPADGAEQTNGTRLP